MKLRAVLLAIATFFVASLASPQPKSPSSEVKKACVAQADQGQALRGQGKLSAAKEQFARCSRDECPGPLRQDCATWMNEVVQAMPSVVVGARDAAGKDLVDVRVTIDGKAAAERLDGQPILLDPGVHQVRYQRDDGTFIEERVVVRAGEKNRALTAKFPGPAGAGAAPVGTRPVKPTKAGPKAGAASGPPVLAWVLGGVGVAALGTALYFNLTASSDVDNLRKTCAPRCEQSQVDSVRTRYTVAGVAAGVGVVSLGVAAYLFLSKPSAGPERGALRLELSPVARGGHAALSASF